MSCCRSVHDEYIKEQIDSVFTSTCSKKYQSFNDLFCMGCHPSEPDFSDTSKKTIKICKSFVESLWGSPNITQPTKIFDNCGFKVPEYLAHYTDKEYIIPSMMFNDADDFFRKMVVPFYSGYTYEIIDDRDPKNNNTICFSSGKALEYIYIVGAFGIFMILFG